MSTSSKYDLLSVMRAHRRRTSTDSSSHFQRWRDFRRQSSQHASTRRCQSTSAGPDYNTPSTRSSGESLLWSDASNDSDVVLTPATDLTRHTSATEDDVRGDRFAEVDVTKSKNEHASTTLVTQDPKTLSDVVGEDQNGTQLIQKYCCGGGCCFLQRPPLVPSGGFSAPIPQPDNDAYRSLNLKLGPLTQDSALTGVTEYPEPKLAFAKPSTGTTPTSTQQDHPPVFVQPHAPYTVFAAPLFHARELTKPGAEKRTFHFDIDVTDYPEEGGQVDFKVGGAVGICPPNEPAAVEEIFNLLGVPRFLRDRPVVLKTTGGRWPTIWGDDTARSLTTSRRELLTWCSDIQSYPPTKALLRLLAEHAGAPNEKKILEYLSSAEGQPSFCDLRTGAHLAITQLLRAFPSSKPPLEGLLSVLQQLMPRFYSLSNDPHVSSKRDGIAGRRLIEIAVTVHESPDWRGDMPRTGVGSGFLERTAKDFIAAEKAHLADPLGAPMPEIRIPLFRGLMANPLSKEFGVSDGPMMLIGAGVGMAPFRGFILNRLQNANCANKIWLIQGIRDSSVDELYSGELGKYESQIKKVVQSRALANKNKRLDLRDHQHHSESDLTALQKRPVRRELDRRSTNFGSADQESRYVQDEVRQQGDIVWDIIHAVDGRIFVCGSSKGMGEGVEHALVEVASERGGWDEAGAEKFWQEQKDNGRLVMEVW
ncbi:MAG: hypothetical protein Q9162_001984 [Coniocarpon cinnabarinum]